MVLKRGTITIINIFFPPLGVALLCGMSLDVFINSMLFLCAIIPGHIHAFYISMTYFSRKRKVRNGKYPGEPRPMIYCERVQTGGASRREMEKLRQEWVIEKEMKEAKKSGGLSKTNRRSSNRASARYSRESTPAQSPVSPHSTQGQWQGREGRNSGSITPQRVPSSYINREHSRSQRRTGQGYEEPAMAEYGRGNGSTRRSQRV